jgi:carboxylesterase
MTAQQLLSRWREALYPARTAGADTPAQTPRFEFRLPLVFSYDPAEPARVAIGGEEDIRLKGELQRTMILVHGLTGTPNEMRYLAFYFNKLGYNVICPRLANHGQPLGILKRTTWEELYDSLRAVFVEALKTGDKVYVAGLSMSALFVLLLAEEFGDQLAGGICLAPTLFFDGWNVPWYHRLLPLASYTPLKYSFYYKESPPYGLKNERVRQMAHRFFSQARLDDINGISKFGYAFFPVSLFHQLQRLARRVIPMLGRIRAPMLLIHPEEDDVASVKNSRMIHDRISSPIKKLVILTDSYHVVTADQEREKVAFEMKEFLDAV